MKYLIKSLSLYTISIALPPKTYEGLTITGYPTLFAIEIASSKSTVAAPSGCNTPDLLQISSKLPLSDAKSITLADEPLIGKL